MKPHEVASILEIGGSTVRAWSNEFKQYLSPGAQGGDGRYRDFTDNDVRIISYINQMKKASTPLDEVHLILKKMQLDGWRDLPDLPSGPPSVASVPVIPQVALDVEKRSLLREIATLQNRVEQLEDRLQGEQERAMERQESLLREVAELRAQLAEANERARSAEFEAELRLYREGRLKPPQAE
jgi:DNA-binding transcriptional MerR regulator